MIEYQQYLQHTCAYDVYFWLGPGHWVDSVCQQCIDAHQRYTIWKPVLFHFNTAQWMPHVRRHVLCILRKETRATRDCAEIDRVREALLIEIRSTRYLLTQTQC